MLSNRLKILTRQVYRPTRLAAVRHGVVLLVLRKDFKKKYHYCKLHDTQILFCRANSLDSISAARIILQR
jgi:hypothetical protein